MSLLWGNSAQQPPEPKKFANISNDQINSNQQAVPVPYLAGRNYVAGNYISPAYNPKAQPIKTQTGKDSSSTTGYKYFADFALVFCMGGRRPVDSVMTVIVDSDIRWSGNVTRGNSDREVIQVPELGTLCLYWGSETQIVDNTLLSPRGVATGGIDPNDSTTWPTNSGGNVFKQFAAGDVNPYSGHYDKHPAYRGQCYGVFKNWKLGRDRTSVPNIQLELKRGCPWFNNAQIAADDRGVNPIAILYDWFTDTRFGMALPEENLNQAAWVTAYNKAEALGARLSPLITDQNDFRSVISDFMGYIDGWIRRNGTMIEVGLFDNGTVHSAATLTDDDLLAEPELEPQGWGPTFNELTVMYKDREHHFNDYVQNYRDPNNFRIVGGPRPETLQRPWITDADLAKQFARTAGAMAALPFTKGDLTVKREWLTNHSILPGNVITYNSGFYDLSFLLRVDEIEHAADDKASAKMTVEWDRSKWPSLYIPPGFQGPGGFVIGPRAIWQSRITEVPYLMANHAFETQVVPLAIRANQEVHGFRTWISLDGGTTYQIVPNDSSTSSFCAYGRLSLALAIQATGMWFHVYGVDLGDIVTQTDAQWRDDTLLCIIDAEVMSVGVVGVQGGGGRSAQLLRGRFGTAKAAHVINSDCYFIYRDRLRLIDNAGFTAGQTVLFKLQPFTDQTDFDLGSITPISYVISGFGDVGSPVLAPAPGPFYQNADISINIPPAGFKARYTTDGTPTSFSSREWRKSGGNYVAIHITDTTTFRVRFFADSGRTSAETIGTYTKSSTPIPGGSQCGAPSWNFTGTVGRTGGTLTFTPTTSGSTIWYSKNSGPTTQYTGGFAIACNFEGDVVEFWATKAGMTDSPHRTLDNTRIENQGGGGGSPPFPQHNPP